MDYESRQGAAKSGKIFTWARQAVYKISQVIEGFPIH